MGKGLATPMSYIPVKPASSLVTMGAVAAVIRKRECLDDSNRSGDRSSGGRCSRLLAMVGTRGVLRDTGTQFCRMVYREPGYFLLTPGAGCKEYLGTAHRIEHNSLFYCSFLEL